MVWFIGCVVLLYVSFVCDFLFFSSLAGALEVFHALSIMAYGLYFAVRRACGLPRVSFDCLALLCV